MIRYYKSVSEELVCYEKYEEGVWINLVCPTEEEIKSVCAMAAVDAELIKPALDEEERSRIESDNGQTLILVDIPIVESSGKSNVFSTIPLGIILTKENIITVCLKESAILNDFIQRRVRSFYTQYKSRFILQILFKNATLYLQYLRQIEKMSNKLENELQKSMKNKELTQLLQLEKSLVYFSTSLKSNESVLEKMLKSEIIKKFGVLHNLFMHKDMVILIEEIHFDNNQKQNGGKTSAAVFIIR